MIIERKLTIDPQLEPGPVPSPIVTPEQVAAFRASQDADFVEAALPEGVTRIIKELASDGRRLELRIFVPDSAPKGVLLAIHGGGFVLGRARFDDGANAQMCAETGLIVVSPEYRLAPAHPYPAGLDDCLAALKWVQEAHPDLPVSVYGDSAGGCLAAATALYVRDHGWGPLRAQVLVEPVLDVRLTTESMRAATDTAVWDYASAQASWRHYLQDAPANSYASPALADSLAGLPDTFLLVNQCDPLLDEGLEYGRRLANANVAVELHLIPQAYHDLWSVPQAAVTQRARRLILDYCARLG